MNPMNHPRYPLCWSAQATIIKYIRMGGLNSKHLFLTVPEVWQSKINVSVQSPLPGFTFDEYHSLLPQIHQMYNKTQNSSLQRETQKPTEWLIHITQLRKLVKTLDRLNKRKGERTQYMKSEKKEQTLQRLTEKY